MRSMIIEASSFCNLQCPFCTQWKTKRGKSNLSLLRFKEIISKLPKTISAVALHFSGEACLNPELPKMVKYLSEKGICSEISSNGTLPFSRYKEIVEAGLGKLIISLDGVTKEKHEKHRVGSNFQIVLSNIKNIAGIKSRKTKLIIQTIATKENEEDLGRLIALAKEMGADEIKLKTLSLNIASDPSIEEQKIKNAQDFLPRNGKLSRYVIGEKGLRLKKPRVVCPDIRLPVIAAEGDVVLCCIDLERTVPIGNIFESKSFLDLWMSKKYREVREKALYKKLEICQNCNYTLMRVPSIRIKNS